MYSIRDDRDGNLSLYEGEEPWLTVRLPDGQRHRTLAEKRLKQVKRLVERDQTDTGPDPRDEQIVQLTQERDALRADLDVAMEHRSEAPGESDLYRVALEEIRSESTTNVRRAKLIAEQALGGAVEEDVDDAVEE